MLSAPFGDGFRVPAPSSGRSAPERRNPTPAPVRWTWTASNSATSNGVPVRSAPLHARGTRTAARRRGARTAHPLRGLRPRPAAPRHRGLNHAERSSPPAFRCPMEEPRTTDHAQATPTVRLRSDGPVDEATLAYARTKIDAVVSRPGLPAVTGVVRIVRAGARNADHPWRHGRPARRRSPGVRPGRGGHGHRGRRPAPGSAARPDRQGRPLLGPRRPEGDPAVARRNPAIPPRSRPRQRGGSSGAPSPASGPSTGRPTRPPCAGRRCGWCTPLSGSGTRVPHWPRTWASRPSRSWPRTSSGPPHSGPPAPERCQHPSTPTTSGRSIVVTAPRSCRRRSGP